MLELASRDLRTECNLISPASHVARLHLPVEKGYDAGNEDHRHEPQTHRTNDLSRLRWYRAAPFCEDLL